MPTSRFSLSGTDHDSSGSGGGAYSRPIVLADGSINLAAWTQNNSEIDSPNSMQAIPRNNFHDPQPQLGSTTIYCPSEVLECWAPVDLFTGLQQTNQRDTIQGQEITLVHIQPDGTFQQFSLSQNQIECVQYGTHYTYVLDDGFLLPGSHVGGDVHNSDGVGISDGHQYQQNLDFWFTGTCETQPPGPNGFDLMVIPNGAGGVLVASETNDDQNPVWIKNVTQPAASGAGTEIRISSLNTLNNLVIGENGNAFAAGSWNFFETPRLVSFNLASGAENWSYDSTIGNADDPGYVDIVAAGPNNSLYAVEGGFFDLEPKIAFTLDGSGVRTDNPSSAQSLVYLTSAGIGSNTWFGQTVPQTASLGGVDLGVGRPMLLQSAPLPLPGMAAIASNLIDSILSTFQAASPSGAEGYKCAPLDKKTGTVLKSAYESNRAFLSNTKSCSSCDSKIFQPLKMTRNSFITYLSQDPQFCDGTRSLEPGTTIGQTKSTVAAYFQQQQQDNAGLTAVTVTAGPSTPLWVFFDPAQINTDSSSVDPHFYPSMMFHEGLHGYTKLSDADPFNVHGGGLCEILKINLDPQFSDCAVHTVDITDWIEDITFPQP